MAGLLTSLVATQVYLPERFRFSAWKLNCDLTSNNGISPSWKEEKEEEARDAQCSLSQSIHAIHFNLIDLLFDRAKHLYFFRAFSFSLSLYIHQASSPHFRANRLISLARYIEWARGRISIYLRPPTYDGSRYTLRYALHVHPLSQIDL